MANLVSGDSVRQRLEKFAGAWIESRSVYDDFDMTVAFAASESALARREAFKECAKLICHYCSYGIDGSVFESVPVQRGNSRYWEHKHKTVAEDAMPCAAAAIHDRADREGE